ncbi:MAG: DUF58 domain-containing protein [Acidimicrobiales bacterium]|jgi:uncharacterized protein (DUF58 family)
MLTARGRRTITLGLIAGAAGRILGIPELFGLASASIVVALVALARLHLTRGTVTITARAIPPIVNAGEPAVLELTIEQSATTGWLSGPVTLLTDYSQGPGLCQPAEIIVPRLARGDRAQASFELSTERRGAVEAGAYEAVSSDALGLARRRLSVSRPARCIVLPRIEPLATVVPEGLDLMRAENGVSAAERLIAGTSMLRHYAQGDDLRRVHWRTTARVGELMVRDGGDLDEPDRIATTVLLDVGDQATPADELDRAVEVAASVLSVAADESISGVSGAYRLLMTTGLDTGGQRGHENLQNMLIALAGAVPPPTRSPSRFSAAVARLGRPGCDEVLVIVGAFGESQPDEELLEDLARVYAAVVVVLVGAAPSPSRNGHEATWRADNGLTGSRDAFEVGSYSPPRRGRRSRAGVLTVPLGLRSSLAAAWSLERVGTVPRQKINSRNDRAKELAR